MVNHEKIFLKFSQNFLSKARLNKNFLIDNNYKKNFSINQNGVLFIHCVEDSITKFGISFNVGEIIICAVDRSVWYI